MELTYLKTFCEVVASGSYTRAAERLGYSQSSVTAQISRLEEMYGAVLLERSGRGMSVTFAGKNLLPYARQMLALSEEAKAVVSGGEQGILNIGSIETLAAYYLPHRLHRYRQRYPQMQLKVTPGSETRIIAAVKSKDADFGLIFDSPYTDEELEVIQLREEPLLVILHPEHPLAQMPDITPSLLAGEALVLTEESCTYRQLLLQELKRHGIAPRIDMEFGNLEGIKQAVKHRWGAAFLPRYAVEEELASGSLTGIPFASGRENFYIQLIYRKERKLTRALSAFIAEMLEP
ncbi:LysR family transcriptional regulator ['Paenibacillus yunnanensis' Narsing Rao et al. 2020]|uniref:LysR family transcriptional regulator n=1 Tax=Paenibacillus tengchongensis TaxID=2608684 RepID=UPI00124CF9C3|nr:LysR family transcriptional regulator [Paenibacillus tengchongensis]